MRGTSIALLGLTVQVVVPTSAMVSVPAGTFPVGCDTSRLSERPRHLVTIGAYAIDVTEVTARDYSASVAASPREYDLEVVRGGGFGSGSPALLRTTARGAQRS
jgi:hypothetical protein